jgi:hypothetical protein
MGILDEIDAWNRGQMERLERYNEMMRARRGLPPKRKPPGLLSPGIEPPTEMESIGRGVYDLWEPVKQGWYNLTDSAQAQAYRQHRAEDERLYNTGLLGRAPLPGESVPTDAMRWQGRMMALGPFMGRMMAPTAEALASQIGSMGLLEALNTIRKRMGWLE